MAKSTGGFLCVELRASHDGATRPVPLQRTCKTLRENLHMSEKKKHSMQIGMWNIWSMVDTEGFLEVACQQTGGQRGEDRKVDQIVCELARYVLVGCVLVAIIMLMVPFFPIPPKHPLLQIHFFFQCKNGIHCYIQLTYLPRLCLL